MQRNLNAVLLTAMSSLVFWGLGCGGGGSTPTSTPPTGITLQSFQAASIVFGQSTFTAGMSNQGGATGAATLDSPEGGTGMGSWYVPDTGNNRVLGFAAVPGTNGQPADFALGQPNLTSSAGGTSSTTMSEPFAASAAGGRLAVADTFNNRILIWTSLPMANAAAADVAVGQVNLTTSASGLSQTTLDRPADVLLVGDRLIVADRDNSRILIWNSVPGVSGAPADVVVGQSDFVSGAAAAGPSRLNRPTGVWSDGVRLAVADTGNNRVLIWTTIPTTDGASANVVVGQPNFATSTAVASAQGLDAPGSVFISSTQLIVADTGNNRVLIYDPLPTVVHPAASVVIGQDNFTNNKPNDDNQDNVADATPTARTLNEPEGVAVYGTRLFVTDLGNNRVLIYDGM